MLRITDVTARYSGAERPVLADLALTVPKGGLAVLLGGSATGKSSVIRLITGELHPERGQINANGVEVSRLRGSALARYRRSIGLLSNDHRLLDDRTVEANIAIRLEIEGLGGKRRDDRLRETLERFGLLGVRSAFPRELSVSERQRVAIARAVVTEPFILLADEPSAHLDAAGAEEIAALLAHEHMRGMTVVIATHDPGFEARFREAQLIEL